MPVPITAVSAGAMFTACQGRRISPFRRTVRGVIRQGKIIADSRVRDADFYFHERVTVCHSIVCIFCPNRKGRGRCVLSWAQRGGWGRFFSALLPPLGGHHPPPYCHFRRRGALRLAMALIMSVLQFNRRGGRRGFFRAFAAHGQAV